MLYSYFIFIEYFLDTLNYTLFTNNVHIWQKHILSIKSV
jgi:hypothetical protein